jgi:hypothetical protein
MSAMCRPTTLRDEWLEVAGRHGLPAGWRRIEVASHLAGSALDVACAAYRAAIPETPGKAAVLLDAVAAALRDRGELATRSMLYVPLQRTPATPRWGPSGTARLAVSMEMTHGWELGLYGLRASPAIAVYAPLTPQGAAEVADVALAITHGQRDDPFRPS